MAFDLDDDELKATRKLYGLNDTNNIYSKDWIGNKKSTFAQLGASNHTDNQREINDFYATDPHALEIFLDKLEDDNIKLHKGIWECACGQGHLSEVLKKRGHEVYSTDIIDRGYGDELIDFLNENYFPDDLMADILTNPPYNFAQEFVEKALDRQFKGFYTIMFLKIQFLEGQARKKLFEKYPPRYIYVNSKRQLCAMNGDFDKYKTSAICYCWFIWEKGYKGEPTIRWI